MLWYKENISNYLPCPKRSAMPFPIICAYDYLQQYLISSRDLFSKPQDKSFVIVLLGGIRCQQAPTLSGLQRCVAQGGSLSGFSRFFAFAPRIPQRWWSEGSSAFARRERRVQPGPVSAPEFHCARTLLEPGDANFSFGFGSSSNWVPLMSLCLNSSPLNKRSFGNVQS